MTDEFIHRNITSIYKHIPLVSPVDGDGIGGPNLRRRGDVRIQDRNVMESF